MHQKNTYFTLTLFLFLSFLFIGCFNQKSVQDVIIVKVNDHHLTSKMFAQRLSIKLRALDVLQIKEPQNITKIKKNVIDEFIHETIITKWAKNKKITVSQQELERKMKQVIQDYPDDIAFRKILVQSNRTMETWKKDLQKRLLEEKVFQSLHQDVKPPTLDHLKSYYETHKSSFVEKEKVYIEQFLLKTKNDAYDIYNKLKDKQASSKQVKNSYKINHSKLWVERGVSNVFEKAFLMKKGVWSDILESPYGFHIYKVLDRKRKNHWTFNEAKGKVHKTLMAQKQQAKYVSWLEDQATHLDVFLNEQAISDIYIETMGEK